MSPRRRYLTPILLLLSSCWLFFPVRQDPGTVQALNALKPMIRTLYDSFKSETVDLIRVAQVMDRWGALRAREEAKGDANDVMIRQARSCRDMFEAHVRNRIEGTAWSASHHDNQLENMLDAIELAIRTEMNKAP